MLTLVRSATPGQGTTTPKRRRGAPPPSFSLTRDEARCLRAAVRGIARQHYGTLRKLAAALGVDPSALTRKRSPHPGLAVALWRLTGVPLDRLLTAQLVAVRSSVSEGGAS